MIGKHEAPSLEAVEAVLAEWHEWGKTATVPTAAAITQDVVEIVELTPEEAAEFDEMAEESEKLFHVGGMIGEFSYDDEVYPEWAVVALKGGRIHFDFPGPCEFSLAENRRSIEEIREAIDLVLAQEQVLS
jgi:hypothetical protein